ncbi:hypothetical protein OQ496_09350 [Acetobacter suratthaniensis]|uniref:Uncharacterized protein n=1 Tax=Acetobacter suratthaniensis TaxID=1502841 RepID=A0ABS3LMG3_9PROT|nr:hypothetical protein [Acetobacter suratthaniensis]MBO1328535.1 hypothetical protein [Acetobacter suratthaniensis]MCX2566664.1 hypothetical protein [Acetobacter suratthaniensis]
MSRRERTLVNLPVIFDSMSKALAAMEQENIKWSLSDVIDRIGADMARIVGITQGDGGTMADLQTAAWSMAVASVLHFSMVQENIEHTMQQLPVTPHNRTIH